MSYLQRNLGVIIKIKDFHSFAEQQQALKEGKINLIYANPYDTSWLIRQEKFIGIAQPLNQVSEATIIAAKTSNYKKVEDLCKNCTVAAAINEDIRTLGTILLEPANLTKQDLSFYETPNHITAIKAVLEGKADIAMIPSKTYQGLSNLVSKKIEHLVSTSSKDIESVGHCLVIAPQYAHYTEKIKDILRTMPNTETGQKLLADLSITQWKILDDPEDIVFMIDLIDTLQITDVMHISKEN